MKIVNEFLVSLSVSLGVSSVDVIHRVIELENGHLYKVIEGNQTSYVEISRELFDARVKYFEV